MLKFVLCCKLLSFCWFQPTDPVLGGECQVGQFCPGGSSEPTPCTEGWYCDSAGLDTPVGLCDAGWYCPMGSSDARQVDCPLGYFCLIGSARPEPCRNGTYGDATNLAAQSECRDCDPGYFCNETAATGVSGPCAAGEW